MLFTRKRPLRVGTDCSGIEAPIVALQQLKVPFSHEFSSEIDKHCIATIKANFSPKTIFGDMKERKLKDIPDIDLYVCGFPCQSFSIAGKRQGTRDPRGTVFWECLKVIRYKKPIMFVLENVRGLLSIDNGETFKTMILELDKLKIYNVRWKVLNTADYGIPQSRKRVFIVGILKKNEKKDFEWPKPVPCRSLEEFVDWDDNSKKPLPPYFYGSGMDKIINKNAIFIDLAYTKYSHKDANIKCPCITTASHSLYNFKRGRYANSIELLKLQGFTKSFHILVSKSQIQKQIGNSMSVNVLTTLLRNIFQTVQLNMD